VAQGQSPSPPPPTCPQCLGLGPCAQPALGFCRRCWNPLRPASRPAQPQGMACAPAPSQPRLSQLLGWPGDRAAAPSPHQGDQTSRPHLLPFRSCTPVVPLQLLKRMFRSDGGFYYTLTGNLLLRWVLTPALCRRQHRYTSPERLPCQPATSAPAAARGFPWTLVAVRAGRRVLLEQNPAHRSPGRAGSALLGLAASAGLWGRPALADARMLALLIQGAPPACRATMDGFTLICPARAFSHTHFFPAGRVTAWAAATSAAAWTVPVMWPTRWKPR
jgi:hypothetical protein